MDHAGTAACTISQERFGIEAGAADQRAIDIGFLEKGRRHCRPLTLPPYRIGTTGAASGSAGRGWPDVRCHVLGVGRRLACGPCRSPRLVRRRSGSPRRASPVSVPAEELSWRHDGLPAPRHGRAGPAFRPRRARPPCRLARPAPAWRARRRRFRREHWRRSLCPTSAKVHHGGDHGRRDVTGERALVAGGDILGANQELGFDRTRSRPARSRDRGRQPRRGHPDRGDSAMSAASAAEGHCLPRRRGSSSSCR